MWSRPWPLEGSVQRVVEKRRPLDGVEVVARHEREALGDGEEAGRLRNGGESFVEVGAVHDAGERAERRVVGAVFMHQRFERAAASGILVRIRGARSVEADRAGAALYLSHVTRFDEGERGGRIDEAPDQPGGRRAIDADL